jgi:hypothetical protein
MDLNCYRLPDEEDISTTMLPIYLILGLDPKAQTTTLEYDWTQNL